jgi:hypothetical protein
MAMPGASSRFSFSAHSKNRSKASSIHSGAWKIGPSLTNSSSMRGSPLAARLYALERDVVAR